MVFPAEYRYEELDQAFDTLEASYVTQKRESPQFRGALLCDVSAIRGSAAKNRKRVAGAFEALGPLVHANMVGQAFVLDGAVARGALTAIFWLKSPPWPARVFARQEHALAWLEGLFQHESIKMPMPPAWWLKTENDPNYRPR